MSPMLIANPTWVAQVHYPVAMSRTRVKADRATSSEAHSRSHATSLESTPPTMRWPYTTPTHVSREVTPSNDNEVPSDNAAHHAQDSVKSGNKRHKQCPLGTTTIASNDEDHGWEAGSSGKGHISATMHSGRRLARTHIVYFKRLLEEACPNHAYLIRHKLKDCGMMRSFMTSGSLTWGTEPDEEPNGNDAAPFPEGNTIMTVFGGRPLVWRSRMSSLGPKIPTRSGWGCGGLRV
jgi:hypothetical protein